ncbi:MAG: PD-(D/E)XK nuclease family protein [Bacilli bacterium]|nr:PD-(D/E)XK nuclease family protein [Bacilli bacterium]
MNDLLQSMDRKVILSSSLATARRFVQRQNLRGTNVLNYALHTVSSLVQEALSQKDPDIRIVGGKEASYILLHLILEKDFGLKEHVKSIGAAQLLLHALDDYRMHGKSGFPALVPADYEGLLSCYADYLQKNHLTDGIFALNGLRDAKQTGTLIILDDVILRPLEKEVLETLFSGNVNYWNETSHDPKVAHVFSCYGQFGEVLHALDFIEKKNLALRDVEILYSEPTYENFARALCESRGIPYSLSPKRAASSNLVAFLRSLLRYYDENYKFELLENVLANDGLDPLLRLQFHSTLIFPKYVVGFGKERSEKFLEAYAGNDKTKALLSFLKAVLDVTQGSNLDYDKLLQLAYSYIRNDEETEALRNPLAKLRHLILEQDSQKQRIDVLEKELSALTYSEPESKEGIVFGTFSRTIALRKHLFILGLNQKKLVGSSVENAFIEDLGKYEKDLPGDEGIHISKFTRKKRIQDVLYLITHSDSNVYLSFSSYDKINLRDDAEGVYLLGLANLPDTEKISPYAIEKSLVLFPEHDDPSKEVQALPKATAGFTLSPSATLTLLQCPLCFYYDKMLGLPSLEFPELDESQWLAANAKGTFFHGAMENYYNHYLGQTPSWDYAIFEEGFQSAKEEAVRQNPISNESVTEDEIFEVQSVAQIYLQYIIGRGDFTQYKPLANEFKLDPLKFHHPLCDAITFTGSVDRVDGYVDENNTLHLRLVDYKTGRYKEKKDQPYCQHVLYSYVLESALPPNRFGLEYDKVVVDRFIYSYPFDDEVRENEYARHEFDSSSDDYRLVMDCIQDFLIGYIRNRPDYLQGIIDYIDANYVPCGEQDHENVCKFCKHKSICAIRLQKGHYLWKKKKPENP